MEKSPWDVRQQPKYVTGRIVGVAPRYNDERELVFDLSESMSVTRASQAVYRDNAQDGWQWKNYPWEPPSDDDLKEVAGGQADWDKFKESIRKKLLEEPTDGPVKPSELEELPSPFRPMAPMAPVQREPMEAGAEAAPPAEAEPPAEECAPLPSGGRRRKLVDLIE